MDITPVIPQGKQVIESYGTDGFKISGNHYIQMVLVLPDNTVTPQLQELSQIDESFVNMVEQSGVELLIIGSGATVQAIPAHARKLFRAHAIGLEVMDTGAACRTYNILLAEERKVAALLLPI